MFEHGPKRHSYQLREVKFQCPAKESTAETDQRLSKELARYILPSGGPSPSPPSPPLFTQHAAKEYSNLGVLCARPFLRSLCPSLFLSPRLFPMPSRRHFSRLSSLSSPSSLPVSSVQIKLIFEQRTLLSYEFYRSIHGMEMFSRPATRGLGVSEVKIRSRGPLVSRSLFAHLALFFRLSSHLLSADRSSIL